MEDSPRDAILLVKLNYYIKMIIFTLEIFSLKNCYTVNLFSTLIPLNTLSCELKIK